MIASKLSHHELDSGMLGECLSRDDSHGRGRTERQFVSGMMTTMGRRRLDRTLGKPKVVFAVSRYAFLVGICMYKIVHISPLIVWSNVNILLPCSRTETPKSCPACPVSQALLPLFGDFVGFCVPGPKLAVILLVLGLLQAFCVMSKRNLTTRSFSYEV